MKVVYLPDCVIGICCNNRKSNNESSTGIVVTIKTLDFVVTIEKIDIFTPIGSNRYCCIRINNQYVLTLLQQSDNIGIDASIITIDIVATIGIVLTIVNDQDCCNTSVKICIFALI